MSYKQTVDWLFSQLPNYQLQGSQAYKPGLDTIKKLLNETGNPEKGLRFLHVAGTNGKGSVSHLLASIFIENGYKTGLFTSPHLHDFRERIKINGEFISENFVVDFVENHKTSWEKLEPTFFEITTAMAFEAFRQNNCEICIIETGLGGRLDSTNVIVPELSIITNIGLDHTAFLGNTLAEIAFEKAGIIKEGVPVVVGELNDEAKPVFEKTASQKGSELIFSEQSEFIETDLNGAFQQKNIATVLTAVKKLQDLNWNLSQQKIKSGLLRVISNTNFKGRFQKLQDHPTVIVDAAHNAEGVKVFLNELTHLSFDQMHLVYGASNDKNLEDIFKLFPKEAHYYFSEFDSKRSVKKEEFMRLSRLYDLDSDFFDSVDSAMEMALLSTGKNDLVGVFGSFYLIEKIIP